MPDDARQKFVGQMVDCHESKLRKYFARRLRNSSDIADLAQEVYLRLIRVNHHDRIRNPEAYLFTIASHVLAQHNLAQARKRERECLDVTDPVADAYLATETDYPKDLDFANRVDEMEQVLNKLSPNPRACLVLHYREGWTLVEIATRLGVSRSMVKKHIAKAMSVCRQHLKKPT